MERGLVMQFSRLSFFRSRISQWTSPHDVHPTDHDMRQRQLPETIRLYMALWEAAGRPGQCRAHRVFRDFLQRRERQRRA
jgi:hypothetical protein